MGRGDKGGWDRSGVADSIKGSWGRWSLCLMHWDGVVIGCCILWVWEIQMVVVTHDQLYCTDWLKI